MNALFLKVKTYYSYSYDDDPGMDTMINMNQIIAIRKEPADKYTTIITRSFNFNVKESPEELLNLYFK